MTNLYAKDAVAWGVNGHYYRLIPKFSNNGWFGLTPDQAYVIADWGGDKAIGKISTHRLTEMEGEQITLALKAH